MQQTSNKKIYTPKRTVSSLQASFMIGIMRSKGYSSQDNILRLVASLSTSPNFSDISFDEARYLIKRLPKISRSQLDAFTAGKTTLDDIGLAPYNAAFGKRKWQGDRA